MQRKVFLVVFLLIALSGCSVSRLQSASEVVSNYPNAPAVFNEGLAAYEAGNLDEAFSLFEETISVSPDFTLGYYYLGHLLFRRLEYDRAEHMYQRVLELDPDDTGVYMNLGAIEVERGNLDTAEEYLLESSALGYSSENLYINLSNLYFLKEDYDQSEQVYLEGLNRYPQSSRLFRGLGSLYKGINSQELAIASYYQALVLDPSHGETVTVLADMLNELGELELARNVFTAAIENSEPDHDLAYRYGYFLYQNELFKEAIDNFELASSLSPTNTSYLKMLGNIYKAIEDYEKAIGKYLAFVRILPEDSSVHYELGLANYELENYEEAISHFHSVVDLDDSHVAEGLLQMGYSYMQLRNVEEAIIALGKSRDLGNSTADELLGEFLPVGDQMYMQASQDLDSVDINETLKILEPCAIIGHGGCLQMLGVLYLNGEYLNEDLGKAIQYGEKAYETQNIFGASGVTGGAVLSSAYGKLGEFEESRIWAVRTKELINSYYDEHTEIPEGVAQILVSTKDSMEAWLSELELFSAESDQ